MFETVLVIAVVLLIAGSKALEVMRVFTTPASGGNGDLISTKRALYGLLFLLSLPTMLFFLFLLYG